MKASSFHPLPQLRRYRIAVSVFFFLAGFTFATWASRIPHIQAKLSMSDGTLGAVLFALPIGLMVSLLLAGGIINRLGSRNVLLIAAISYSILLPFLGMANNIAQLASVLVLFGIAGNLFNIAANTQAVGVEKIYGRQVMASFHGIWSLAGFSGAAIGTLMVKFDILPWQHFCIAAGIGFALIAIFIRETLPASTKEGNQTMFALPDRQILQLGLIAFGCLVCEGTMFDWSGVYFTKIVHAPAALTTIGYAAFMACMATGRFLADRVVMRLGSKKVLQASGIVITVGLALAVWMPTLWVATIAFMLVGFGVSGVVPIVYSIAGKSKHLSPGQALAAVSTVGFAGFLAGPPLVGFIAQASDLQWSFGVVALLGLMTTILSSNLKQ